MARLASASKRKARHLQPAPLSKARLQAMIEDATVDAYDSAEQTTGFFTMIEQHLACPFRTAILRRTVTVARIDLNEADEIVAVCSSAGHRQAIPILDLPLPSPPPRGADWIAAYRLWLRPHS